MSKNQLVIGFIAIMAILSWMLYRLGLPEMILVLFILFGGFTIIFSEKIPGIRKIIEDNSLTHVIESRKYPFLSVLNFIILPIARSSNMPKLYYVIGIFLGIATVLVFLIDYSKKAEHRKEILLNIIFASIALALHYFNYSKLAAH